MEVASIGTCAITLGAIFKPAFAIFLSVFSLGEERLTTQSQSLLLGNLDEAQVENKPKRWCNGVWRQTLGRPIPISPKMCSQYISTLHLKVKNRCFICLVASWYNWVFWFVVKVKDVGVGCIFCCCYHLIAILAVLVELYSSTFCCRASIKTSRGLTFTL